MKGVLLLSMTIFFALCIINGCEGWPRFPKPRKPTYSGPTYPGPTYPRPTLPRPTWRRSATIGTDHKTATMNDDIQDRDFKNENLDNRYIDMNNESIIDDIDERDVNYPEKYD
uniref:Myticalin D3 n=1 Tax=Mytilus galloprovincialis TaxID=29158 RepID=A0A286RMW1_MYTGA|nr:myticalin D3 [Mytilus galloprovincialis]